MIVPALKEVHYDPSRFENIETVDEAVRLILLPAEGLSSADRWKIEAPYLMKLMEPHVKPKSAVLDYGCGIGRLAKPLIQALDCKVIGVDISANMRALATSCVGSDSFFALHPDMLSYLSDGDFDFALSIWTLQHCFDLRDDVRNIEQSLKLGGKLFVVNDVTRCVPTSDGAWADDGIDVRKVLGDFLTEIEFGRLGSEVMPNYMRDQTFWAVYQK